MTMIGTTNHINNKNKLTLMPLSFKIMAMIKLKSKNLNISKHNKKSHSKIYFDQTINNHS